MLKTKRLTLRAPRASDLDDLHAIYSDPKVMAYWSSAPHTDIATTKTFLGGWIASLADPVTYFAIEKDSRVIGAGGMHKGNEVGFILASDHWRQGIVSEAMQAIIPYLFEVTDHSELTADADPLNAGSVGLLRSLGFVETHRAKNTFCINGVWSDSVYFALKRTV